MSGYSIAEGSATSVANQASLGLGAHIGWLLGHRVAPGPPHGLTTREGYGTPGSSDKPAGRKFRTH